jgi:hypothetical protein
MLVSAPEELRRRLHALPTKVLVALAACFRPGGEPDDVEAATRFALRSVARRHEALSEEIAGLDAQLKRLVAQAAPELLALPGVGTNHAATRLGRRQPREAQERNLLRESLWGFAHRSVFGQGGEAPAQQGRQPRRQQGAAHDLLGASVGAHAHPAVRRKAHCRGEEQAGDHEVPETVNTL